MSERILPKEDPKTPSLVQVYRELGTYDYDYSVIADNGYLTEEDIKNTYEKRNTNVVKFISPGGCHTDYILYEEFYPKEWSDRIIAQINAFLND